MRQHLSFWEHFTRGNAASYPDCRATAIGERPVALPLRRTSGRWKHILLARDSSRGTEGSNPAPSSAESIAKLSSYPVSGIVV